MIIFVFIYVELTTIILGLSGKSEKDYKLVFLKKVVDLEF